MGTNHKKGSIHWDWAISDFDSVIFANEIVKSNNFYFTIGEK